MLERKIGETDIDYGLRLIEHKIECNPQDLDWQDIVDVLGLNIHRDTLRKAATQQDFGAYRIYKYMKDKLHERVDASEVSDEILSRIELEKIEVQKERVRLRDQRRELNKLIYKSGRLENIKEEIIKAIKESSDSIPLDFSIREYVPEDKEGVLILGDWHYGLKVNNHWNHYNTYEFFKRIEKLVQKTIQYGRLHGINKLHVFGLGDFVHGIIHTTTRVASVEDVVKQTKTVAETLANILVRFAGEFKHIDYYMVTGNHGRVSPNKQDSIDEENFEEFIRWYLETKFENAENITIHKNEFDREIIVADILERTCFATHGDRDKISDVAQNLALMLKKIPQYVFTADKHHLEENEIHGVEVIINRSLSGVDQYAKSIRKTSFAGQTFMIFNREDGRECTYNIKLN